MGDHGLGGHLGLIAFHLSDGGSIHGPGRLRHLHQTDQRDFLYPVGVFGIQGRGTGREAVGRGHHGGRRLFNFARLMGD